MSLKWRFCRFRDKKCTKSSADKSANKPHQPEAHGAPAKPAFTEEDVQLVADQTGKSLEKAKEALIEADGDLAKAILLLSIKFLSNP